MAKHTFFFKFIFIVLKHVSLLIHVCVNAVPVEVRRGHPFSLETTLWMMRVLGLKLRSSTNGAVSHLLSHLCGHLALRINRSAHYFKK